MKLRRARRSASVAIAAVALLCVLASCGTSPPESQPSPPATTAAATTSPPTTGAPTTDATAAACEDVEALRSSLEALTKVKPAEDGLAALTTAIANVKASLDAAEASASPVLQPSVAQVNTAFGELQTAVDGVTADNLRQKAPAILSAIKEVATATQALSTTMNQACPG
jgi:hypothetical protein